MPFEIIQESNPEESKPFKIKGIAMIKNSISGNGRHYSDVLVDKTVNSVKEAINANGSYPLTMMADHPGITSNKTLSTIGKITDMYLEGDNAFIEAEIANTSLGKDIQELIKGKFVEGLSIRASKAKTKKKYIKDRMVNDVLEMELNGVDLVTNPGVKGARVTDILESDQNSSTYISIEEEVIIEEDIMDYSKIQLDELKNKRPDLIESLKTEFKPLFESEFKVEDLQESVTSLETEKITLQESLDSLKGEKEVLEGELSTAKEALEEKEAELKSIKEAEEKAKRDTHIAESISKLKFADSVKEKIKEKVSVLESVEEIDAKIAEEVEFLEMVIKESTGVDLSGAGHTGDNGEKIDEDEEFMKMVREA